MSTGLFGGLFARGDVAAEVSDRAFLRAMLDTEVALAHGLVSAGLAAPECAVEIEAAAADAGSFDIDEVGRGAGEEGTPVPALLRELRGRISGRGRGRASPRCDQPGHYRHCGDAHRPAGVEAACSAISAAVSRAARSWPSSTARA